MTETVRQLTNALTGKMAAGLDDVIAEGIRQRIGDFELSDLEGRLNRVNSAHDPDAGEIWELDGRPFLQTLPPETIRDGNTITIRQSYRYLGTTD